MGCSFCIFTLELYVVRGRCVVDVYVGMNEEWMIEKRVVGRFFIAMVKIEKVEGMGFSR